MSTLGSLLESELHGEGGGKVAPQRGEGPLHSLQHMTCLPFAQAKAVVPRAHRTLFLFCGETGCSGHSLTCEEEVSGRKTVVHALGNIMVLCFFMKACMSEALKA